MDKNRLRAQLHAAIARAYGDTASPRYDFVARALARPFPYPALLLALTAAGFTTTDTTDGNDDVAWHLGLQRAGDELDLAVSMAGPFARAGVPVASAGDPAALREQVRRIFRASGLHDVPDDMLDEPGPLRVDGRPLALGQALFADDGR